MINTKNRKMKIDQNRDLVPLALIKFGVSSDEHTSFIPLLYLQHFI